MLIGEAHPLVKSRATWFGRGAHQWWKEAIVYQVYPRSFKDGNGDGIGDLPGLISKLDYIQELGADTIWLSPIYASPNDDNGYDISDFRAIHPDYGTMADFERLVRELKVRSMRILMDQVVNHTSDEHPWFVEARSSRSNRFHEWYHWHPGNLVDGRSVPPNNWKCAFDGSTWEWNEPTGEFYLHLFSRKQPDLNWANPAVREAIFEMLEWWLDKGVDGFRMDVINMLAKAPGWPDAVRAEWDHSPGPYIQLGGLSCNQPGLLGYLEEMRERVFSDRDIFTVGEAWCTDDELTLAYTRFDGGPLNSIFQFYFHYCSHGWQHLENFARIHSRIRDQAWPTVTLGNHDSRRLLSKFGSPTLHPKSSAKLLAAWLLSLPATPFLLQGDELGLTDVHFDSIGDYRDIQTLNRYRTHRERGLSDAEALDLVRTDSRDNARTPVPWTNELHGGFSTSRPWIALPESHLPKNARAAATEPDSVFTTYRKLISLRKLHSVLVQGDLTAISEPGNSVLAYWRHAPGLERILVVLNWQDSVGQMPGVVNECQSVLWSNTPSASLSDRLLQPWQATYFLA